VTRHLLLAPLALALLPGLAPAASDEPYGSLTPDQVEKLLGTPGVVILDANVPEIWAKNRVPGAIHIADKHLASVLPSDKGTRLVFYCTNPK